MGTHATTTVYNYDNEPLITFMRQSDGYWSGHGQLLADFLKDITLVNGIGNQTTPIANGPGCLAAQVLAHFKRGVGGIYVCAHNAQRQTYHYDVFCVGSFRDPGIICMSTDSFNDHPSAFAEWVRVKNNEEEDQDEVLRASALDRLSSEEKRVLGLSD